MILPDDMILATMIITITKITIFITIATIIPTQLHMILPDDNIGRLIFLTIWCLFPFFGLSNQLAINVLMVTIMVW